MEGHRLVFIGGLHRSGTSPFHALLRDHPLVSGFRHTGVEQDEGQHLQSVYRPARAHGGPGRFGFDPGAHLTEDSDLVSAASARQLLEEWGRHWDLRRPVLVEKSPPNLVRTRFLQALFPTASFIVIVRHPLAVSLATRKWAGGQTLSSLLRHWFRCHELFLEDAPRIARLLVVSYEHLCADPAAVMAATAAFLGIDDAFDVSSIDPAACAAYADEWDRFRRSLPRRAYASQLVRRFERRANRFGYRMDDLTGFAPLRLGPP